MAFSDVSADLKLNMDKPNDYWSRRFVESSKNLGLPNSLLLRQTLDTALEEYLLIRKLVGDMTKANTGTISTENTCKYAEVDTRYTWNRIVELNDYYYRATGHETI